MKKLIVVAVLIITGANVFGQTVAEMKKVLDTTSDPIGYVKYRLKKKYKIDTVAVMSSSSFLGLADSLAYKGKVGKVYGPWKGANYLIKVLAKVPNTYYHVSHILLDTTLFKRNFADSMSTSIINKIQSGTSSFSDMASTYSADRGSSSNGGDLGWFVRGAMLQQLDVAIAAHKKGDIFKVWTPAGLHIVTVKDNPKKDVGFALLLRVIL
ncbi:MAG: peptidylprolyl isomerase [Ferruginibacter sp.]